MRPAVAIMLLAAALVGLGPARGACAGPIVPAERTLAGFRILTPNEIALTCRKVDVAAPVDARVAAFWASLDRIFYSTPSGDVAKSEEGWPQTLGAWIAHVKAPGDPVAEKAWRDRVAAQMFKVVALSSYQLTLMRCHFPLATSDSGLNEAEVEAAFRALALGVNATDPQRPNSGRMDSIHGWFHWAGFIDTYFALPDDYIPDNDRAAWGNARRHVLYGLLLHLYHDSLCPGPYCQAKPDLKFPGLSATDERSLHDYAYAPATDAGALMERLYPVLLGDPKKYPMHAQPAGAPK